MRQSDATRGISRLFLTAGAVFLSLVLTAGLAQAQAASAGTSDAMQKMMDERLKDIPSGEEGVNRIMTSLDERLKLTDEQKTDIRPSVESTVAQMEKIRDRFEAGEITPMALGMQMQMTTQKAAVLIEPILTEEQQVEYAAMRQEQRREMMKAMQQARPAAGAAAGAN
jgi:hypothetical protein